MGEDQTTIDQDSTPIPLMILSTIEIFGIGLYAPVAAIGLWTLPPQHFPLIIGLFVLTWPLFFFSMTLIHELGHLIAGKLVGLTPILVILGKLTITCERGVIRLHFARQGSWRSGGVQALPRSAIALRARMCLYLLGGPVMAIIVSIAVFITTAVFAAPAFQPGLWWLALYLMVGIGFAQFLPTTNTKRAHDDRQIVFFSDGRALARWWSCPPAAERALALQVIIRIHNEECALKDLPDEWLDRATAFIDDQIDAVLAKSFALGRALVRGDDVAIHCQLRYFTKDAAPLPSETAFYILSGIARYLTQQLGPSRPTVMLYAALIANEREDIASARAILDRLPTAIPSELRGLHLHASAMTLHGEGHQDEACALLDRALAASDETAMASPLSAEEIATLQQFHARIAPGTATVPRTMVV